MKVDLHNHTPLCKHAIGEPEEFIKKAIEKGTEYFGFSDHAPMEFDKKHRMDFSQMEEYESEIKRLKKEYENEINILLGYEVDFLENYLDERVLRADVDYLIGSIHFLDGWGFDNPEFIGEYKNRDIDKIWEDYFYAVERMAKSGLFQIAGHIDLMKVFNFKPKKDIKTIAKNAMKAIKEADMTIELNTSGYRKPVKELYPSDEILEMIKEFDISITFGSDAHKIEDIGFKTKEAEGKAKEFGFSKCVVFRNKDKELINF